MTRTNLIQEIFEHTPRTYKGINGEGEHVIQLRDNNTTIFATLERLNNAALQALAGHLPMTQKLKTAAHV